MAVMPPDVPGGEPSAGLSSNAGGTMLGRMMVRRGLTGRTIARYAAVAAIVLVVGGIFVVRDVLPRLNPTVYGVLDRQAARPKIGVRAPDFVLQEAGSGREVRLSDYRGRPVVLNFWATWCGPCRAEMPELEQTHLKRGPGGANDLVILGVNYRESSDAVTFFENQVGVSFPLVLDRKGDVADQYGAQGLPATYFIDREGIVRYVTLGPVNGDPLAEGVRAAAAGAS